MLLRKTIKHLDLFHLHNKHEKLFRNPFTSSFLDLKNCFQQKPILDPWGVSNLVPLFKRSGDSSLTNNYSYLAFGNANGISTVGQDL